MKNLFLVFILLFSFSTFSQKESNVRVDGILYVPKTQVQRLAMVNLRVGMTCFQTDGVSGLYVYTSAGWVYSGGGTNSTDIIATGDTRYNRKDNNLSDLSSIPSAKINLGISNVDNISDANKPVSIAQAAINASKLQTVSTKTALIAFVDSDKCEFDGSTWEKKSGNVASNGYDIINVDANFYWQTNIQTPFYDLVKLKKDLQNIVNNVATKQIKWLVFGDSMAGTKTKHIFNNLNSLVGTVGAVNGGNFGGITTNGGTITSVQDYNVFPFSFTQISSGNFVTLGIGGVTAIWNFGKIYLLNNGATYTVKINNVAVSGQTNVTLPNNNAVTIISLSPTLASQTLTVEANTGNVKMLSSAIINTSASGLVPFYLNEGGNDMSSWIGNTQALANFNIIVTDINPDVISYDMKEIVSGFDGRFNTLLTNFKNNVPNSELLLFTQTPTNLTNDDMIANNAIIRSQSKNRQLPIFDTYKYFKSYAALNNLGWGGDGVHPANYA